MAKQTKRVRKFQATGGVKARIEKGTVTKRGKLRQRTKGWSLSKPSKQKDVMPESQKTNTGQPDDFLGNENLGALDLDSFFNRMSENVEQGRHKDDVSEDATNDDALTSTEEDLIDDGPVSDSRFEKSIDSSVADDCASYRESDSVVDSDDEDVEEAEARMKIQLAKMKQSDPDFHKFLKENEESLLDFKDYTSDDIDEKDDLSEKKSEDLSKNKLAASVAENEYLLTMKRFMELKRGAFVRHEVKCLKELMLAFKCACHLSDSSGANEGYGNIVDKEYIIDSSKVFDELMMVCLQHCHDEFIHHLMVNDERRGQDMKAGGINEAGETINPSILEKNPGWSRIKPLVKSFFQSTMHLLSVAKDYELLAFVLKTTSKSLRFLSAFPRVAEKLLRTLISLWSAPLDSSEDYQVVRLNSFFRIRQLALTQPFPFIESILKKTYLAYTKRSKFGTSVSSLHTLTFMGNCLVELYSLDYFSSYQHSFVYIRQLALLLRNAMQNKTEESLHHVFCWQFFHCMKLWVSILSSAAKADDGTNMRSLIYPLAEIILAASRFAPSPVRLMPFRFHCIRLLQQLAAASETFIPTASLLLDCLDWKEWYLSPLKSSTHSGRKPGGLQLLYTLKLSGTTNLLRTHESLEAGMNDLFLLLQREIELYRFSPGFPEFSIGINVRLNHFSKTTRNSRWRAFAKACIELIEKYASIAVIARSKISGAPKDVQRLEFLLPIGAKTMQERHEESVSKEHQLLETQSSSFRQKKNQDDADVAADVNIENSDYRKEVQSMKHKKVARVKEKNVESKARQTDVKTKQLLAVDELMEENDHMEVGIDWLDDESA